MSGSAHQLTSLRRPRTRRVLSSVRRAGDGNGTGSHQEVHERCLDAFLLAARRSEIHEEAAISPYLRAPTKPLRGEEASSLTWISIRCNPMQSDAKFDS